MITSTGPGGWIELSYGNGTQYKSHCGQSGRVARILFDCDPYAGKVTMECIHLWVQLNVNGFSEIVMFLIGLISC